MPLMVEGRVFFTATEIAKEIGVVRQTLWRWRQVGKIPAGRRYRDRQILFTPEEVEQIKEFAHRVEPIGSPDAPGQRTLFD
jgi:predicted site-specific integrase-resolvase